MSSQSPASDGSPETPRRSLGLDEIPLRRPRAETEDVPGDSEAPEVLEPDFDPFEGTIADADADGPPVGDVVEPPAGAPLELEPTDVAPVRLPRPLFHDPDVADDAAEAPAEVVRPVVPRMTERPATAVAAPATGLTDADAMLAAEATRTLRTLIDEAGRTLEQLRDGVASARDSSAEPAALAEQLQDRLRVGARMLKAFQAQIDRVDAMVEQAEGDEGVLGRLDAAVAAGAQRLEAAKKDALRSIRDDLVAAIELAKKAIDVRAEKRARPEVEVDRIRTEIDAHVERLLAEATRRLAEAGPTMPSQAEIDARVEQAAARAIERVDAHAVTRRQELDEAARQLRELQQRALEATDRLEAAHVRVEGLLAGAGETERDVRRVIEEARESARSCIDARGSLSSELRRVGAGLDELAARSERLGDEVDAQVQRAERARSRAVEGLERLDDASGKADAIDVVARRLDRMIERLAPWEELLCRAPRTADGLPRPAVDLVEHLEQGIGRDVAELSETMRSLADRVEGLRPARGPGRQIAEARPTPGEPTPRPEAIAEAVRGGDEATEVRTPEASESSSSTSKESPALRLRRTGSDSA